MIYLDNAATTYKKPQEVLDAVLAALESLGNSGRGAHGASLDASRIIFSTRELLAEMFNSGDARYVSFTSNSTEGLNTVIQGILKPGQHAITSALEHNSVLRPLYLMESRGCYLSIVPADKKGNIDYSDFENNIRADTKMIVCTHASNLTGNLLDIGRIGAIAKKRNILFVVDASQTAGVIDIDMQAMNIDILCVTGHKSLLGPQGTGAVCMNKNSRITISPLKVGGSGTHSYSRTQPEEMPSLLEAGTLNAHSIAGLHAGLTYIKKTGIKNIRDRELSLMKRLLDGFRTIDGVRIYGDFEQNPRAPIVSINIRDLDSSFVSDELSFTYGISTRPGAHCAPLLHMALGTREQGAVRFSISHFNTEEEIDSAIRAVRELSADQA